MELRHLRCFLVVAEELHYGRAAERLYMSQPGVSRTISQLEKLLGSRLLDRDSRNVELTPAGRDLVEMAGPLVSSADAIAIDFAERRRRHDKVLRVGVYGAGAGELTAPILAAYRKARPGLKIELQSVCADVWSPLSTGELDAAFVIGSYDDERLSLRPLFAEARVAAVPYTHELADAFELSVSDLLGQRFPHCTDAEPEHWKDIWAMVPEHDGDQDHREHFDGWPPDPAGQLAALLEHNVILSIPTTVGRILPVGVRPIPIVDASPVQVSVATTSHVRNDIVGDFVALAEQTSTRLRTLVPSALPPAT